MTARLCKTYAYLSKYHMCMRYLHHKRKLPLSIKTLLIPKPCHYPIPLINPELNRRNYTIQVNTIECWKCGIKKQSLIDLFCNQCKTIQNPHDYKNCFSVMGLEQVYDIDQKALVQKYRSMQNMLHPDKYSNKTEEEREISEEYSALVNHAYHTLQSPMKRALHMLTLRGEAITEKDTIEDQKFLLEIMDISEDVEEAQTFQRLEALQRTNNAVLEQLSEQIGQSLKKGDVKHAKEVTLRMRYYHNIGKQITGILREMGHIE